MPAQSYKKNMEMYHELIIDLYKNPLNKRVISNPDSTKSGANVTCGDRLRVYVKFADTNGGSSTKKIEDVSFEGEGCAISIAAASLVTENAKGKTADEIVTWATPQIFEWLETELSPARIKCGLLALETLQHALKDS